MIAYRRAATDVPFESLHPKMTASGGSPDAAMLVDGDVQNATSLPIPAPGANAWIQYEFPKPETMRAITIVTQRVSGIAALLSGISNPEQTLQASDDGQTFRDIVKIPDRESPEQTISFEPVTAKYFRVVFKRTPPPPLPAWAKNMDLKTLGIKVGASPN